MRTFLRCENGAVALTTIVLLPLLMIALAGTLELGLLRVIAERGRLAADLATVVAVNDQDDAELIRTGALRPRADADDTARQYFASNLAPMRQELAAGPETIAASANVAVFMQAGAVDGLTGRIYVGPTVRLAADLPVRTPVLAVLVARPITTIRILSASTAR